MKNILIPGLLMFWNYMIGERSAIPVYQPLKYEVKVRVALKEAGIICNLDGLTVLVDWL